MRAGKVEFVIGRDKEALIKFMKNRADKKNLDCQITNDKISVRAKVNEDNVNDFPVPVEFKGTIQAKDDDTVICGKFTYGFGLTEMVLIALLLIVIRFVLSVIQMQLDNIIMCAIVTVLLIGVIVIVNKKSTPQKNAIYDFFSNLEKK